MFIVEQVVFRENVQDKIGRSLEAVIRRLGVALLERTVVDLYDDAGTEPGAVIQLDRRVDATVQAGREQPVVVDARCKIGQQRGLANIEFKGHNGTSWGGMTSLPEPCLSPFPLC